MRPGNIILLNGTSSAGKTTIARQLQDTLPIPYLYTSIDDANLMLPPRFCDPAHPMKYQTIYRAISGFHHSIRAFALTENNVIVDHVLWAHHLPACVCVLEHLPVLFVGVLCDLEELERREQQRGDRAIGLARSQIDNLHAHSTYDVTVDTTTTSPEDCVTQINTRLADERPFEAFRQLRHRLSLARLPTTSV